MALKKKDRQQKENEAKIKEKQKKLKEMRLHQAQPTPFVQPTVDRGCWQPQLRRHRQWEAPQSIQFSSIRSAQPQTST